MKKMMFLGGVNSIIKPLQVAKELDVFTITVDNIPNNIAHKYSDKYYNESILDKDAILNIAKHEDIDGITSFGVDPGVTTAAFVAESMGLQFQCSYKTSKILQNKGEFRSFLKEHNFNCPNFMIVGPNANLQESYFNFPVISKPIDSSGSKGCLVSNNFEELIINIKSSINKSFVKRCIIEEYIEPLETSDSDWFIEDGKFVGEFSQQLFDPNSKNPLTPSAYIYPNFQNRNEHEYLLSELNRLANLLDLHPGVYNIETRISKNHTPYIMEVTPRGGGNSLSEIANLSMGYRFIENDILCKLNRETIQKNDKNIDFILDIILHSNGSGLFQKVIFHKDPIKYYIYPSCGDPIDGFNCASDSLGNIFFKYNSFENAIIDYNEKLLDVILK